MPVKLSIQIKGQPAVEKLLGTLSGPQAKGAYAAALNDTGFHGRRAQQKAMRSKFDRVTPFIERAPKVFPATPDNLSVAIAPTLHTQRLPTKGGKVGVDPQDVLQAQEYGGKRADKRSEVALRRAGILPSGYQTAIPKTPYPGSDDGRGNMRGAFVAQLISYLQASGEQGYRANMTDKRKRAIHKGTAKTTGRKYFVSYGRMRGQHLAPGIWASSGTHGVDVKPVLMFVRNGTYTARINQDEIAREADLQEYLDRRVRYRIRQVAGE